MDLKKLKVELLNDPSDRDLAESAMSRCHHLGHRKLIGNNLVYAVSYRGEWVAILYFDQPVHANKHRESHIGWSREVRKRRLKHVCNNSRYLISPKFEGTKNLASKALSLVTTRLSTDWENKYGFPMLAVETYVDPEHNNNQGTCYESSGWEYLRGGPNSYFLPPQGMISY